MLQSMKLGVDVNRHKEIIVKAISAVLLLLLKHFKLNHIYQVSWARLWPSFGGGQHPGDGSAFTQPRGFSPQFEYMAQHLVFANCIPLILKFFNQNIMSYITAKNRLGRGCGERRPACFSPSTIPPGPAVTQLQADPGVGLRWALWEQRDTPLLSAAFPSWITHTVWCTSCRS